VAVFLSFRRVFRPAIARALCLGLAAFHLSSHLAPVQAQLSKQPAPGYADPRMELRPGSPQWKEFGDIADATGIVVDARLEKSSKHGSGVFAGDCHVVTAQHVVFADGDTRTRKAVTFSAGHTGSPTNPWKVVRRGAVIAWGESYMPDKLVFRDWALIRLEKCVEEYPTPVLMDLSIDQLQDKPVHILGFPNTAENPYRRYKLVVQRDCRLLGDTGSSGYSTNCMTEDGQSGGPVVAKNADGQWRVVGVHSSKVFKPGVVQTSDGSRYMSLAREYHTIIRAADADLNSNPPR
jgi:hypothetical protein